MQNKLIVLLTIIFISSVVMLGVSELKARNDAKISKTPEPTVISTPSPIPAEVISQEKFAEAVTPDGKKTLTMKSESGQEEVSYTFSISEKDKDIEGVVFKTSLANNIILSIPFNTFSPDGKYIFLKETTGEHINYLVVPISKSFDVEKTVSVNITKLFYDKYTDYIITDVTGWGGESLVVINTDKIGGGIGPSFWFEAPTGRFIKLSTRFN